MIQEVSLLGHYLHKLMQRGGKPPFVLKKFKKDSKNMPKEERFVYFGMDILQEDNENQPGKDKLLTLTSAPKICEAIETIKQELQKQNVCFESDKTNGEIGNLEIRICEKDGLVTPAQIKLFPLLEGEKSLDYNLVNGVINMIREITNEQGECLLQLPIGCYYAEISKGSEYEIIKDEIVITRNCVIKKQYELVRFVNLKECHYFAGDLHHHSIFSSPVYGGTDDVIESPELVCNSMRAMGLSFGALSDHHNILNHAIWKSVQTSDFLPIISKEISTSNGHVMSLGVEHDVIYNIPEDKDRTDEYLRGEFNRITKEIKEAGGLAQLNHPRDRSISNSWNPNFYDMIDIFDTMELWNGATPMHSGTSNWQTLNLWRDLLDNNRYIPVTSGSDTHNIKANDYHKIFADMIWVKEQIVHLKKESEIRKKYATEIEAYLLICEKVLPILEKWAETSLTTGCVRTYARMEGAPEYDKIVGALKKGNSFLTNGPILIPTIKGVGPGERVRIEKEEKVSMNIRILSNEKLSDIYFFANENRCIKKALEECDSTKACNYYDYSLEEELPFEDAKWIFYVVAEDCTNMAISNPIFLAR